MQDLKGDKTHSLSQVMCRGANTQVKSLKSKWGLAGWKERITAKLPQKAELLGDTSPLTTGPKRQHWYHEQ
jgi:hypothetical protein